MKSLALVLIFVVAVTEISAHDKSTDGAKKYKNNKRSIEDTKTRKQPYYKVDKLESSWAKQQSPQTEEDLIAFKGQLKAHEHKIREYQRDENHINYGNQPWQKSDDKEQRPEKKRVGKTTQHHQQEWTNKSNGKVKSHESAEKPQEEYSKHVEEFPRAAAVDVSNRKDSELTVFQDKKLQRLWVKIETGNYTAVEINSFKVQFESQQAKINTFNQLLDSLEDPSTAAEGGTASEANTVQSVDSNMAQLRTLYREIQENYSVLKNLPIIGTGEKQFTAPRTIGLWKIAQAGNFSAGELASIKGQLFQYEVQNSKLQEIKQEYSKVSESTKNKMQNPNELEEKIRKYAKKVEKLQDEVQQRIFNHSEL